jgi:hypothetical protein
VNIFCSIPLKLSFADSRRQMPLRLVFKSPICNYFLSLFRLPAVMYAISLPSPFFAFPDSGCVSGCHSPSVYRRVDWFSILFLSRGHRCKPHSLCQCSLRCRLTVPVGWHRIRVRSLFFKSSEVLSTHWPVAGNIQVNKQLVATPYPRMIAPTSFCFCKRSVA